MSDADWVKERMGDRTLADALMQNGCRIDAYGTYAGPVFGKLPAGFRCEGHGISAIGSSSNDAARNWLAKWKARAEGQSHE